MGWRGILRSIDAAHRRSVRAEQKRQNQALSEAGSAISNLERETNRIERNSAAIIRRAEVLEEKLRKNFIKVVSLRYDSGSNSLQAI
jgi:hypothetical protein